jgi:CubicO group peptidase (beta-lactamase class C family)
MRDEKIDNLFIAALNNKVFSGAALAFSKWETSGYDRFIKYYGGAQYELSKKKLTKDHFFDIASLTKPLATVPVLLALFEKKILKPETRLDEIFSFCPEDKKKITIKQLMSHSAGFVPHREYFNELIYIPEKNRKKILLKKILEEKLLSKTEDNHCYSDLGFMLLGLIIEKITGKEIDELTRRIIYTPLGLQKDLIFPSSCENDTRTYVSTGNCLWSKKRLFGVVHDDNCRSIGGVAGHAGLFGTLQGVMQLCEQLLNQWKDRAQHPAYSNRLLQETLKPIGDSTWTMGFDMVSPQGSSAGTFFSRRSVGHLGFTGTSFWIDPEKDCIAVLLTNRVYYGRENWKIKEFRPAFHDAVMEGQVENFKAKG